MREAIEKLRQVVEEFEAYEQGLWPDQCKRASQALVDLTNASFEVHATNSEAQEYLNALQKQVEEARLHVVAFTPHGRSTNIQRLRQRRDIVHILRQLLTLADKSLEAESKPVSLQRLPPANQRKPSRGPNLHAQRRQHRRQLHRRGSMHKR